MMKYMENLDRDGSMSLDQSEMQWHYAAMTHTSMEAAFALLDENKDGKLTGKYIRPCTFAGPATLDLTLF